MYSNYDKKKSHLSLFFVSCIFLTVAVIAVSVAAGIIFLLNSDKETILKDEGKIYLSLQHESNPVNLDNSSETIDSFVKIHERLNSLQNEYYELYRQPLDCSKSNLSFFDNITGELVIGGDQIKCIQISKNVQEDFSLSIEDGRYLDYADFSWTAVKPIPVLLGNNYRKIFKKGDIFEANYLYSDYNFEVTGFLEEKSGIRISIFNVSLDDYIIMPSLSFSDYPKSESDFVTQKIHYANKTSGIFSSEPDDFNSMQLKLSDILSESEVGGYSMYSSSSEKNFLLNGINLKRIVVIIYVLFTILFCLSVFLSYKWIHHTAKNTNTGKIAAISLFGTFLSGLMSVFGSVYILYFFGLAKPFFIWQFAVLAIFLSINMLIAINEKKKA